MRKRRTGNRRAGRPRRMLLVALSALVVVAGATVTPQAFAGTRDGSLLDRLRSRPDGGSLLERLRNRAGGSGGPDAGGGQDAGGCPDVELVFARGTGEPQGLGIVGRPLAGALAAELPGRTVRSFAVVYAAASNQASAGPGATNMSQRVAQVAQACPETQFVIGGYSQGATVTDIAIGIRGVGTRGEAIPAALEPRVAAVVVYGNPLGLRRQTIAQASPAFGPKAIEFCNTGDPVCGGGNTFAAHLAYTRNGTVQDGAEFAARQLGG
jgi:cutinase